MRELPKIELHLHHEGAAPPAFIRGLAQEKSVDIGGVFAPDGSYSYKDFWHFLSVYEAATSVLTTPEDYARLTRAVLEESAENGVIYSETFLSPDFCGGGDVAAWREYLAAIREEAEDGRGGAWHHAAGHRHLHPPFRPGPCPPHRRMRGGNRRRLAGGLRHGGR
jgi:adenosine deaminase